MKKIMVSLMMSLCATTCFAQPKAVVFDFGGVMTNTSNQKFIDFMQESLNLSGDEFREARKEKRKAEERGVKSEDFWISFAKEKGIELSEDWVKTFRILRKEGEPRQESIEHFIRHTFNLSKSEWKAMKSEIWKEIKQGGSMDGFWDASANAKEIELPENWIESFEEVLREAVGINEEMYTLVSDLKASEIPVALLSNVEKYPSKFLESFGFYKPFNPCLLSWEIQAEKPDLKAYTVLLETLNLSPEDVVFIDDKHHNIEVAKKLGIDAVLFESANQVRNELQARGFFKSVKEAM